MHCQNSTPVPRVYSTGIRGRYAVRSPAKRQRPYRSRLGCSANYTLYNSRLACGGIWISIPIAACTHIAGMSTEKMYPSRLGIMLPPRGPMPLGNTRRNSSKKGFDHVKNSDISKRHSPPQWRVHWPMIKIRTIKRGLFT